MNELPYEILEQIWEIVIEEKIKILEHFHKQFKEDEGTRIIMLIIEYMTISRTIRSIIERIVQNQKLTIYITHATYLLTNSITLSKKERLFRTIEFDQKEYYDQVTRYSFNMRPGPIKFTSQNIKEWTYCEDKKPYRKYYKIISYNE